MKYKVLLISFFLSFVIFTDNVKAQNVENNIPQNETPDFKGKALEGMETIMEALRLFIQQLPEYEAPIITPEGDIFIKRKKTNQPVPGQKLPDQKTQSPKNTI
ncbi:MAG: hypothetical protein K1X44_06320 [Alphaproteobacteria bacterium]|nr:hypothetical protein [Alphaproteobacteria bacterium]